MMAEHCESSRDGFDEPFGVRVTSIAPAAGAFSFLSIARHCAVERRCRI